NWWTTRFRRTRTLRSVFRRVRRFIYLKTRKNFGTRLSARDSIADRWLSKCTRSNGRCRLRDLFLTRNETRAFAPPDFWHGKRRKHFAKFRPRLKTASSLTPKPTASRSPKRPMSFP